MPARSVGWKRIIGLVTLVMICVVAVAWSRSSMVRESLVYRTGETSLLFLGSNSGQISFHRIQETSPYQMKFNQVYMANRASPQATEKMYRNGTPNWRWHACGFDFGNLSVLNEGSPITVTIGEVPYWSIVLSLVLIAAWLFRSSRKASGIDPASGKAPDAAPAAANRDQPAS